ncbi:hypothetical protein FNV43_RR03306 [Rhamnella rubrinervis]|uniref:WAT1-related protein n=1 Tax=Rhamnella rubrinervis TaxID=2594499 RepID=A0A8K0MP67_9ROSA|nr:hypothetical protein FNV43_RR03306 [Rhamnella rubrinervis]
MCGIHDYKPLIAMIGLQLSASGVALITRAALLQGMNPRVFVVYRQAIATLVIAPVAYVSRRRSRSACSLGLRSFSLIFFTALIGITINQNIYYEGLYLTSSSMATAMGNLVPAITFIMAFISGLEKVTIHNLRSIAKILGTVLCVGGAVSMALLRGPKLINAEHLHGESVFGSSGGENWLSGCLLLFASTCFWSLWLMLQVPTSASYPDHLSLSAWMCFLGAIQSAAVTLFLEQDPEAWKMSSSLQLGCCFVAGIISSGVAFFVQAWCISMRGPLFVAMFNPLSTVIVAILASIVLAEKIYAGGLAGAVGVILGLYILLWGKAKDMVKMDIEEENDPKLLNDHHESPMKQEDDQDPLEKIICSRNDLEEPLLSHKISSVHDDTFNFH